MTLSQRDLDHALMRRGRAVLAPEARAVLAEQLEALVVHYRTHTRWDLRGPRRQAAQFAETLRAQLAALEQTIDRRQKAMTRRGARTHTAGVAPETEFTLHTMTWARQIRQWRAATDAEARRWARPPGAPEDTAWRNAAADVRDLLTDAGVPITTSDTGIFCKVLRAVSAACGRSSDSDVRAVARKVATTQPDNL